LVKLLPVTGSSDSHPLYKNRQGLVLFSRRGEHCLLTWWGGEGSNQCPLHWQVDSKPPDHQGSPFQPFILQVFLQVSNLRTPQGSLSAWLHVGAARSSDSLLGGVFAHVSDVSVILGLFLMPTWGFRPQGFFMWLELLIAQWFRESCTF